MQAKIEEAEQAALKGGAKTVLKLEQHLKSIENELETEQRRGAEAAKNLGKADRRARELQFQASSLGETGGTKCQDRTEKAVEDLAAVGTTSPLRNKTFGDRTEKSMESELGSDLQRRALIRLRAGQNRGSGRTQSTRKAMETSLGAYLRQKRSRRRKPKLVVSLVTEPGPESTISKSPFPVGRELQEERLLLSGLRSE